LCHRRSGSCLRSELTPVRNVKRKAVFIRCDRSTARALGMAIRAYAEAAYPGGGSECAQVARAALLDAAADCELHDGGDLALRRRQLALLRACVRWYFSADGPGDVESGSQLRELLGRKQ